MAGPQPSDELLGTIARVSHSRGYRGGRDGKSVVLKTGPRVQVVVEGRGRKAGRKKEIALHSFSVGREKARERER